MSRPIAAVGLVLSLATDLFGQAQQQAPDPGTRAFDLERRGQHGAAAEIYRTMLTNRPADLGALLGLERSLGPLGKVAEMVPELRRGLSKSEPSAALFGIAVRVYAVAGLADSVRMLVDRWVAVEPRAEGPYQEWGSAALGARDRPQAKVAYLLGRERLGRDALAGELAQLATIESDYEAAVREWLVAVEKTPPYRASAISLLAQVPVSGRPSVLRHLDLAKNPWGERIAAGLTIRWGDPVGGIRRLERALPALGDESVAALQDGLEEIRGQVGREGGMAKGIALELLGTKAPAQATRYWLDAAQAYADAGDQGSARRMLSRLAADPKASPTMAASATSTLVTVLVAEGKREEAAKQVGNCRSRTFIRNMGHSDFVIVHEERPRQMSCAPHAGGTVGQSVRFLTCEIDQFFDGFCRKPGIGRDNARFLMNADDR